MNRSTFDAMLAQYATPTVTGEGAVSWDKGAHCVIPSVEIMGKCVQDGTPTPDAPIEPVFSEGTEVIVRGRNLANAYANGGYNMTNEKIAENTFRMTCGSATGGYGAIKIDNLPVGVPLRMLVTFCPEYPRSQSTYAIAFPRNNCGFNVIHISSANEAGVSYSRLGSAAVLSTGSIEIYLYNNMDNPGESAIWTISIYLDEQAIEEHTPYFDGGTAVAPELLAIPGTEYMDKWNPQTGRGVRRLHKFVMDGTYKRNFETVHNTQPADVFVVSAGIVNGQTGSGSPLGLTDTTEVLCNYFPYEDGYYYNRVAAFRNHNRYYGLVVKFPYSMFGITKREKTNEELLALVNAWLVEKNAEGNPLYYYYVMETPEEFQTEPQPLIQPKGTGQIIQTGGNADNCPITVKCVTHS